MAFQTPRDALVLAALETTYGTEPTWDAAVHTQLVYGSADQLWVPNVTYQTDLNPITGTMTLPPDVIGAVDVTSNMTVLLQGSGQPSAEPWISKLLRSAGFEMIQTALTSPARKKFQYKLRDTGFESIALEVWHRNIRKVLVGGFSKVTMQGDAGGPIKVAFSVSGQLKTHATATQHASPTKPANRPVFLRKTGLTWDGYAGLYAKSFSLDFGWGIQPRPDFAQTTSEYGRAGFIMAKRDPKLNLVIEAEQDLASFNPYQRMLNGVTSGNLAWAMSSTETTPQDVATITCINPQVKATPLGDSNGLLSYNLEIALRNLVARGEFTLDIVSLD